MSDADVPAEPVDTPVDAMTVDELAGAVRYHNWRYFALNAPVISDYAFDQLTRRLTALAPDHPALAELDGGAASTGAKVFHDHPMLSLDKAYDAETVQKWAAGIEGGIVESPKVDGVAASLRYDADGHLFAAVTRGDGKRGEVFTDNARFIAAIPPRIPDGPVEIRGEIFMPLSVFRARFAGDFANPRNTTAGAIKQKEPHKTAGYGLSFFAYSAFGRDFETVMDWVAWGTAQGLPVVESTLMTGDDVPAGYARWLQRRATLDYETDGVVYLANLTREHARLGATAHHPRYAIAYKFQGESGTTTLEAISWSVSRSGAITPVAIIAPIELSGAMVSRCSLHNLQILRALGASPGATVVAMRRGGVIPHVEAVVAPGPEPAEIPATCPSCGQATVERGDVLMCSVPLACPDAVRGTLEHFTKVVEIDGFGPKILAQLMDRGQVAGPVDLYRLTTDDLMSMERIGPVLAAKLIDSVNAARTLPLPVFLRALGVDDLGGVAAQKLAETFRTIDGVLNAEEASIAEVYGLGELTARAIRQGLVDRADLIAGLREHVAVEDWVDAAPVQVAGGDTNPFLGKGFVFTGKMATMDRKEAQARVRGFGGATPSGVARNLEYLVIGDSGSPLLGDGARSTKHKKADKLVAEGAALQIITESAFLEMLAATEAAAAAVAPPDAAIDP